MLKNILIPTDFGEAAQNAQLYAIDLAQKFDAKLTLLHVYGVPTSYASDKVHWPLAELAQQAQHTLDLEVEKTRAQLPTTQGHIEVGDPRERILAYAQRSGVDLIVLGTHGRRGLAHLLMGSVAERVVRLSPVPVLTCHSTS
jgi:nucleotide-binding universal stress UspA family protein